MTLPFTIELKPPSGRVGLAQVMHSQCLLGLEQRRHLPQLHPQVAPILKAGEQLRFELARPSPRRRKHGCQLRNLTLQRQAVPLRGSGAGE